MSKTCPFNIILTVLICVCHSFMESGLGDENDQKTSPDHVRNMKAGTQLFQKSVRTIFAERCLDCHGGESLEGGFNLASREALLKGGESGAAVIPGNPDRSLLFRLVNHTEQPHMPYDEDRLADKAIKDIKEWIRLGAPYDKPLAEVRENLKDWTERTVANDARDFWAFEPLRETEVPQIPNDNWARTDIDRFVTQRLSEEGLEPNEEAPRNIIIRRAYFGMTGLPPSREELDMHLADQSSDWYEKMVDRLLASPHFGERQARWWLDIARFAESHGFEQDYNRDHAYHFRDFVIKAFNQDMPYDQFVRWQLAGDEIAPEDPLALMATGFLGAGVFPTQLTEKEFEPARYDELDDMVATMGTSMLGMTIGCARCHDHKFDPIPSADYYRLISTFGRTIRSHVEVNLNPEETEQATAAWAKEHSQLEKQLQAYESKQLPEQLRHWMTAESPEVSEEPGWLVLHVNKAESAGGATMTVQPDESVLATGNNPDFDTYTFVADTSLRNIRSLRLEALAHESLVRNGPGRAGNGNMGVGQIDVTVQPVSGDAKPVAVKLQKPRATFEQNNSNLAIAASIDQQDRTGWAVDPQFGKDHAAAFEFTEPIAGYAGGTRITVTLKFDVNNKHNIGRARLSVSDQGSELPLNASDKSQALTELTALIRSGATVDDPDQRPQLLKWYRTIDSGWLKLSAALNDHTAQKPKPKLTTVMVSTEGLKPLKHHADGRGFPHFYEQTFFLKRGDATQKIRPASPGFLQVLTRADSDTWTGERPAEARTSLQRRQLAAWMTDNQSGAGHLLARVIVNRLWKHHLGRGIVSTCNDFGKQGELPTHPELLDWLAQQLINNDWRLKPIHRLIVSSTVYRQSSTHRIAAATTDPENHLYWRFTPRRLEAEEIRDAMLSVSGHLDRTQFGPGTLNEGHNRRSIYFMIKRSKLIPMMQIFDAPEPLVSVGNRPTTTIASQALMFMNSPHVRRYAGGLANSCSDPEGKTTIGNVYLAAIARRPTNSELQSAEDFVHVQAKSYHADGSSEAEAMRLAWTDFCQTIMSLNEFVFVE